MTALYVQQLHHGYKNSKNHKNMFNPLPLRGFSFYGLTHQIKDFMPYGVTRAG